MNPKLSLTLNSFLLGMTIEYCEQQPGEPLNDFVFSFWKTRNNAGETSHYAVVPDAGIELITSIVPGQPGRTDLFGLQTSVLDISIPDRAVLFGIRFKLLAVEYVLQTTLRTNSARELSSTFGKVDLQADTPLAGFVDSVSSRLLQQSGLLDIDPRKQKLLDSVYSSKGDTSVRQLARQTGWGARQINRYFGSTFGLPLKEYLEQVAFFSSLAHIGAGNFSPPGGHYYDQSHFIRQSKKHTGSTPKQLYRERDTRFVQLGCYPAE